ncbi:MAG: FkbM family methyltransferase [Candidatus Sumerlaeota bacterium]|nr:FkbM family methyltransferase [Candidatus Sumerlaeota bacterium]
MFEGIKNKIISRMLRAWDIEFRSPCYSQEGEDLIIQRLFSKKMKGFYVDVGAHHPKRFSNTYLLYLRGWRGINIDATPDSMEIFRKLRPADINLEMGISDKEGTSDFYEFFEPALNTFDPDLAKENQSLGYPVKRITPITLSSLNKILATHAPGNISIDLLSMDIEGLDSAVLKSLDMASHRPQVMIIEHRSQKCDIESILSSETSQFLKKNNYIFFSKFYFSCIWVTHDFFEQNH